MSLQLARAHPNLRLILQDLPERIQQAKNEVWPKECPEAIAERRIAFEPLDFFASSPVPGCDVYYVRGTYLSSFLPFTNREFAAEKHYVRYNSVRRVFCSPYRRKRLSVTTGLTPTPSRSSPV